MSLISARSCCSVSSHPSAGRRLTTLAFSFWYKMRWKERPEFQGKKRWHKDVRANPVAERLDAEGRFEEMAKRRKDEIEGQNR
jgi:hypothetical protein